MTIRSPEFETLLTDYYLTAPGSEREAPFDRLVHFIDAHVVSRRRQAVDQFKEMCRLQGLVAVKAEGFNQLLSDLDRLPDGDMADHARQLTHDILNAGDSADDGTPEFTVHEDEDLDRLLNSTAALLSGRANQDVGMAWYDDLQAVLRKLARVPAAVDPNEQIKVEGFDYPTTYADLARIPAEKLWNRYVTGGPYPDAKAAFLVARAIPSVRFLTVPAKEWHDATELPPDNTPVLAELKVSSKKKQRAFAVVSYFRTEPGVHDEAPGWLDEEGTERHVLRWQKITMREGAASPDHNSQNPDCSCPSGNGSLRWPCPVHPT